MVYYVGGLLLFFVPGLHLTRGGMAWMISTQYTAYTPDQYLLATGAALVAGVFAFLLSLGLARGVAVLVTRVGYRGISWATLGILVLVVFLTTGPIGLAICAVAAGIGWSPPCGVLGGSTRWVSCCCRWRSIWPAWALRS